MTMPGRKLGHVTYARTNRDAPLRDKSLAKLAEAREELRQAERALANDQRDRQAKRVRRL
jgi:hypothetical protein